MSSPIKPTWRTELPALALLAVAGAAAAYFYSHFPEQVPTHWNFAGEPDDWSGKAFGAFGLPAMMAGIYLLFLVLPYLDPKKERYIQFRRAYYIFRFAFLAFFVYIQIAAGLAGLGYAVPIDRLTAVGIGILFLVLGNYMGKLKYNWFVGIRTPWTLSSEAVWNKTHRAGGKAFMAGGIVIASLPWLPRGWQMAGLLAVVITLVFGTFAYSYILYRREKAQTK